jgi:tetratricopeptide (TPR) repeat protein
MATPAKFKAFLGRLKETVLDSNSQNVNEVYRALMAAELVQRGVLSEYTNDDDKLMDAVVSTAGRPLADNLPKPLLAAAAAMAGMIAEACATLVSSTKISFSSVETALTRCRHVQDDQLAGLLQVLLTEESQEMLLLHVAEGYFLHAASLQPDPPQMWKRGLDVIVHRINGDQEPFEANVPLSHLISIAESKGNDKRASELSLRLAESWLSPREVLTGKLEKELVQAFVTPYRPDWSRAECVDQARKALLKVNIALIQNDASNVVWHKLLAFRVEWALEVAKIDKGAQEAVIAAKNRGSSLSLETCQQTVRSEVLIESLEGNSLNACATELRDHVLLTDWNAVDSRASNAMELLRQQSERLVDRARVVSLGATAKKPTCTNQNVSMAWRDVVSFTKPIVQRIGEVSSWDLTRSLEEREESVYNLLASLPLTFCLFFQSALVASSCWTWMTCSQDVDDFDLSVLELIVDSLSSCNRIGKQHARASEDGSVLKSSNADKGGLSELECAHATVLSWVGLAHVGEGDGRAAQLTHQTTRMAVAMMDHVDRYQAQQGKHGTAYLLSLLAWSGFHRSPWPFCNITQARAVIRGARATLKLVSTGWGRNPTACESLLLDLSEADAEGGSFSGGFESKADELYKLVLEQTERGTNDIKSCVQSLLKAHCHNGLARLALLGNQIESTRGPVVAQDLAEKALAEATSVRNTPSVPIFLWKAASASGSSALFHLNVSRQLVADSLVRASRPTDAQSFLEDAVRDNPSDFDAAFALGAFRLRMILYETDTASLEETKMAQTQLLKSARIDSGKAGPFALLGIWYEVQKDLKRALGCYSKALLLDPSNPSAGRGVLRLTSFTEMQKICETATNSNSPVNGWAWRAIGRHKAMVENDDELAIICFHKALRCRDIECPQNESLSVFFALPPSDKSGVSSNFAGVWADLAGCYRRVGRYAAAVRAFNSAWQADGEKLSSNVLCSWAQGKQKLLGTKKLRE